MDASSTAIEGMVVLPQGRGGQDERGVVREFFRASEFRDVLGVTPTWRQINVTETVRGAVRGLHGEPTTKCVGLAHGEALGVYLDARSTSPTFGQVCLVRLEAGTRVIVPEGVCNGFQSTGRSGCIYVYAFDSEWRTGMGGFAVSPLDDALGFDWPIPVDPTDRSHVSAKDASLPRFAEIFGTDPLPPTSPSVARLTGQLP
jgi:dTDP-4-dehydrorhamnose 3,5-epimerase